MENPPWKRLVEKRMAAGHDAPYLDRLRSRVPATTSAHHELEVEIAREMADTLGRAGEKVDVALLELDVIGEAIDAMPAGPQRDRKIAAFDAQRKKAQTALWELRVTREAMGLRHNAYLAKEYPIPPKRGA